MLPGSGCLDSRHSHQEAMPDALRLPARPTRLAGQLGSGDACSAPLTYDLRGFGFLADMVTQSPVVMLGGIQAGSVPASGIVTDPNGQAFPVDPSATGTGSGSISLDLGTGEFSASWTVKQVTSTVTGYVRCVADLDAPPSDRFMFLIPQDDTGFYVLTTTNV